MQMTSLDILFAILLSLHILDQSKFQTGNDFQTGNAAGKAKLEILAESEIELKNRIGSEHNRLKRFKRLLLKFWRERFPFLAGRPTSRSTRSGTRP
jgi:hypothetical protein